MRFVLCILFVLTFALGVKAQTGDSSAHLTGAYVDSLMANDSLIRDLSAFIDSVNRPKTLLAIELGVGNGFFTTKSATAATGYTSKTFLTPTVTYLHKSGLGISASAYATRDNGKMSIYQGAITPSFDIGRRNWAAGITYTRYINKDSVSFGLNPLRNDFYVYGVFKKFWLEPGLAYDLSFDRYTLETITLLLRYQGLSDTTTSNIHAHTMAGIFSVQHDFEWFGVIDRNDHLAFTPTVMTLADQSNYISVTRIIKNKIPLVTAAERFAKKNEDQSTGWVLESVGALLNGVYTYKHFLLSPQVLATYFLSASPGAQAFRVSYLINVGLVF